MEIFDNFKPIAASLHGFVLNGIKKLLNQIPAKPPCPTVFPIRSQVRLRNFGGEKRGRPILYAHYQPVFVASDVQGHGAWLNPVVGVLDDVGTSFLAGQAQCKSHLLIELSILAYGIKKSHDRFKTGGHCQTTHMAVMTHACFAWRRHFSILSNRRGSSMGLVSKSLQPASRERCLSPDMACAVRAMIGIFLVLS
jgi:hypothetical protein